MQQALSRRRAEREREAARRSLAAKEATLESLFESTPSPTVVVDSAAPRTPVSQVNPAFTRLFDVDPDRAIGAPVDDVAPVVGGEGIDDLTTSADRRREELTVRTAAGEREFLVTVVATVGGGKERYVLFTDIHEQKRVQQSLEGLHSATRAIMVADSVAEVEALALSAAGDVLGFPHNGTRRYDPATDRLVPSETTAAAEDHYERPRTAYERGDPDAAHAWQAFDEEEPVTVSSRSDLQRENVASKVYLPVGEWGVITLSDPDRDGIDETEARLGSILATNTAARISMLSSGGS
ncbi:PAS domain-containing protein [Halobaculum halobium]|uniref:PAS domain-containing protein n=1 Tax=Halobaculum halobium TaxID=3032281 RepID=A0ABD5TFI5_9EURY|nr:GAF domain-containing protein [Halobaculum sp. SYNS20]